MNNSALEKHYRVKEIAEMWRLSDNTVIRLFATEPGVIRIESGRSERRKYTTLSIPESVAVRVHARISVQPAETKIPRRASVPLRIIRLKGYRARKPGP
jgi:hypothetical protein